MLSIFCFMFTYLKNKTFSNLRVRLLKMSSEIYLTVENQNLDNLIDIFWKIKEITKLAPYQILITISIRTLMIGISAYFINLLSCIFTNLNYLGFIIPLVCILVDTIFICIKRKGNEFTW